MKQKKYLLILLFVLFIGLFACENENNNLTNDVLVPDGDRWKLIAMVTNRKTDTGFSVDEQYYWIVLNDDGAYSGQALGNEFMGEFEVDRQTSTIKLLEFAATKIFDDGCVFEDSLRSMCDRDCPYDLQRDLLKFYYNKTDYLLFKKSVSTLK